MHAIFSERLKMSTKYNKCVVYVKHTFVFFYEFFLQGLNKNVYIHINKIMLMLHV